MTISFNLTQYMYCRSSK